MKSTNIKELQKWLKNLLEAECIDKSDISQILIDFDFEAQQQVKVEPEVKPEIANIEIIDWHKRKFATADHWDVYRKLLEEVGELGEAIARKIYGNIELEFGDVEICLIVLANKLRVNKNSAVAKSHAKNLEKVTLKK